MALYPEDDVKPKPTQQYCFFDRNDKNEVYERAVTPVTYALAAMARLTGLSPASIGVYRERYGIGTKLGSEVRYSDDDLKTILANKAKGRGKKSFVITEGVS